MEVRGVMAAFIPPSSLNFDRIHMKYPKDKLESAGGFFRDQRLKRLTELMDEFSLVLVLAR